MEIFKHIFRQVLLVVLIFTTISCSSKKHICKKEKGVNLFKTSKKISYAGRSLADGLRTIEYQFLVAIKKGGDFLCSGVIISNFYVLTTAQCVVRKDGVASYKELKVHFQTTDLRHPVSPEANWVYNVFPHPEYDSDRIGVGNFALIQLWYRIEFGLIIQPIKLPKLHDELPIGTRLTAVGWKTSLNNPGRQSRKRASFSYGHTYESFDLAWGTVQVAECAKCILRSSECEGLKEVVYCMTGVTTDPYPCFGDLGGIMIMKKGLEFTLYGMVAESFDECKRGGSILYSAVERGLTFIKSKLKE